MGGFPVDHQHPVHSPRCALFRVFILSVQLDIGLNLQLEFNQCVGRTEMQQFSATLSGKQMDRAAITAGNHLVNRTAAVAMFSRVEIHLAEWPIFIIQL